MADNSCYQICRRDRGQPPPQLKTPVDLSADGSCRLFRRFARATGPDLRMALSPFDAGAHPPQGRSVSCRLFGRRPRKIRSMRLFDEHIVARYGGFSGADDYYYSVASSQHAGRFACRHSSCTHSMIPSSACFLPPAPRLSKSQCHLCRNRARRPLRLPRAGKKRRRTLGRNHPLEYLRAHANGSRLGR